MEKMQNTKNMKNSAFGKTALVFILGMVLLFSFGCAGANSGSSPAPQSNGSTQAANSSPPASESEITIEIQNFAFSPASVQINAGAKVIWVNKDPVQHTIVSDSGDFQFGPLSQGQQASNVFTTTGTYAYHCSIHPSMKGTIIVK